MLALSRRSLLPMLAALASLAEAAPLTFNQALERAEQQSPKLAATAAAIDSARSAVIAAAALPDPKLAVGVDNLPVSGPDAGRLNADFMTMQKVGMAQELPNADKRRAREAVAAAEVEVASARRSIERLALRRDTALAWLALFHLQRKLALFNDLERENALLAQTLQARIASGRAQAADALLPKQEAAQLADRRDELTRDIAKARARLHQFVGEEADVTGDAPDFVIDAQQLRTHLHRHPELLLFAAEIRKAEVEVSEARSMKRPDWGVELAYQHRAPQFDDMVSVQFTLDLPVSPATRQEPLIAAKQHELERIDAEREAMLRDHTNELESDLAEVSALTRQLERARLTLLPLAEQKVALQTASYQAATAELSAVLESRRELIEQRLRIVELESGQAAAATRLHFAYGEEAP